MKISNVTAGFALLLLFSMHGVSANDNGDRGDHGERGNRSEEQRRGGSGESRQQSHNNAVERRTEIESHRLAAERTLPSEQGKRANHLSPEERRALRQQINEAGQDIYNRQR